MPIEILDPANSVLFLGSGFSADATNIARSPVPAGHPLLERLAKALDEDPNELDLKSAADEFLDRFDLSLYQLLYETFTISEVLDYQRDIVSLPWARIYTTNYDDIVNLVKGPNFPILRSTNHALANCHRHLLFISTDQFVEQMRKMQPIS